MEVYWELESSGEETTNCNDSFSSQKETIILSVMGGIGVCSISLCVIAVMLVFCFKLHKKFAYRLATYQVMASMLVSLAVMVAAAPMHTHIHVPMTICKTSGFLLEYFMWVKLLFALCLLFHIFCLAIFLKNLKKFEAGYIIFSFCLPVLFTWIPFFHNSYGKTGSWCWIREYKTIDCQKRYLEGTVERFVLWYGPLSVCILISFLAIFAILVAFRYRYYRLSPSAREKDPLLEDCMKRYMLKVYFRKLIPLLIYPVIFFVLVLLPIIHQVHHALSLLSFGLYLAQSVCYASIGFFSSIVLILHVLLARRLKSWNEYFFHKKIGAFDPSMSLPYSPRMSYDEKIGAVVVEPTDWHLSQNFGASMVQKSLK